MKLNKNWVVSERIVGVKKIIEFFIRAKTRIRFCELKSRAWDKCVEEGLHGTVKNVKMKYAKRIGMLVGVCVPFASKEWHQHDIASSTKQDQCNLEIRI